MLLNVLLPPRTVPKPLKIIWRIPVNIRFGYVTIATWWVAAAEKVILLRPGSSSGCTQCFGLDESPRCGKGPGAW